MSNTITAPPALTTIFTPSSYCTSAYWRWNISSTYTEKSSILSYQFGSLGPPVTSDCLPSSFDSTSQYYSPGICPYGYTRACSSEFSIGSSTETHATCCPSQYSCQTETAWPWYSTEPCTLGEDPFTGVRIFTTLVDGAATTFISTITNAGGMNAYGISIRWQSNDFATPTVTSSPTSITPFVSSPTSSTTASSSAAASGNQGSGPSIGVGAIAGIAVGALALGIILGIGIWLLCRRRNKAVTAPVAEMETVPAPVYTMFPKQELTAGGTRAVHELMSQTGGNARPARHELGGGVVHELPERGNGTGSKFRD